MFKFFSLFLGAFLIACQPAAEDSMSASRGKTPDAQAKPAWAIALHGGAGNISRKNYDEEREAKYKLQLREALSIGSEILKSGGTSLDAVSATIVYLENCPLFNAGKGAVFTSEGVNEMDASIMQGSDLNCGAVTGIQNVKNPILAAKAVMKNSEHVFLSGAGAKDFAQTQGLEIVDSSYFFTQKRFDAYLKYKGKAESQEAMENPDHKFGTVGCVALDLSGNLTAGTSTGGMTYKKHGRIGDSPMVGAGTYADNSTCAVSCTGHGEFFIRTAVAHDIHARMAYGGQELQEAADAVVQQKLVDLGGSGGIIAVDHLGHIVYSFNSAGMHRASASSTQEPEVNLFGESSKQ